MMPPDIVTLRLLLPLAAILVSASSPGELTLFFGRSGHLAMTTLRLTMVLSYLELMYSFFREYWIFSTVAGITFLLIVTYGPTTDQIGNSAHGFWYWFAPIIWDLIPTTQFGWVALSVVLAFIFLGMGAAVSLRRPIPPQPRLTSPLVARSFSLSFQRHCPFLTLIIPVFCFPN